MCRFSPVGFVRNTYPPQKHTHPTPIFWAFLLLYYMVAFHKEVQLRKTSQFSAVILFCGDN